MVDGKGEELSLAAEVNGPEVAGGGGEGEHRFFIVVEDESLVDVEDELDGEGGEGNAGYWLRTPLSSAGRVPWRGG